MTQEPCAIAQSRPLPGLAKFYLIQLYILLLPLLLARFGLQTAGMDAMFNENAEPLIWSLALLAAGLCALAVIAGLHSRTAWAPRYAAVLRAISL